METLEQLQKILDDAPEGTTHSNNVGEYGCYSIGGYFLRWTPNGVESTANCNWRSLADIQRIVDLMKLNQEMHQQVNGYLHGDDWVHWQKLNKKRFEV